MRLGLDGRGDTVRRTVARSEPSRAEWRPAAMSYHPRPTAPLLLTSALAIVVAACSAAGASNAPPSAEPSAAPAAATPTPDANTIEHKTGATDIVLRYEEGGGFIMPAFTAAAVPHFTLYGDGTVIFRNPMLEAPPAEGSVFRMNPLRTAKLNEEQIQNVLRLALVDGGLGAARPEYKNDMVADAGTAIFTVEAGGLKKKVSIYALGLEQEGMVDGPARIAFKKLADRLTDFDQGGSIATDIYEPEAYRGVLFDASGIEAPDLRLWPWKDIKPTDFKPDADPNGILFPHRNMTPAEIDLLKVKDYQGGFQGMVLAGPNGERYQFSLRPLLPGEAA